MKRWDGLVDEYLKVCEARGLGQDYLEHTRHELDRYCQQRGWHKTRLYEETASGAKASRPVFDRLMANLRAGRVERLVCYKLDRLGPQPDAPGLDP